MILTHYKGALKGARRIFYSLNLSLWLASFMKNRGFAVHLLSGTRCCFFTMIHREEDKALDCTQETKACRSCCPWKLTAKYHLTHPKHPNNKRNYEYD